jgi:hypothetical protein
MLAAVVAAAMASSPQGADAFWFPRGSRVTNGRLLDIRDFGAVAGTSNPAVAVANAAAITAALGNLTPGDTLLVPEGEFFAVGGISAANLSDVTLQFNGSLHALPDFDKWPFIPSNGSRALRKTSTSSRNGGEHLGADDTKSTGAVGGDQGGSYLDFVKLSNATHMTVRGAPAGRIDGDGKK